MEGLSLQQRRDEIHLEPARPGAVLAPGRASDGLGGWQVLEYNRLRTVLEQMQANEGMSNQHPQRAAKAGRS